MTREERLLICKTCSNQKLDLKIGLICSLTSKPADFDIDCADYMQDEKIVIKEKEDAKIKEVANKGRKKTLNIFYLLIGISIAVIIFSHLTYKAVNAKEITKETVRLGLQIGLLYAIYIGKSWAKTVMTILFIAGIIIGFFSMIALLGESVMAFILLILIAIYGYTIYFLNMDNDFLTFFKYQQKNRQ